jgi:flavin-dependent dehydrogenase
MNARLSTPVKTYSQENTDIYDVAICGSGIAGLTIARQLKLTMPKISILILDRIARPLPNVGFKVGESIDVNDFVSLNNQEWHNRVPEQRRYYSTNHLVGEGYWVWLIPLASPSPEKRSSIARRICK